MTNAERMYFSDGALPNSPITGESVVSRFCTNDGKLRVESVRSLLLWCEMVPLNLGKGVRLYSHLVDSPGKQNQRDFEDFFCQ